MKIRIALTILFGALIAACNFFSDDPPNFFSDDPFPDPPTETPWPTLEEGCEAHQVDGETSVVCEATMTPSPVPSPTPEPAPTSTPWAFPTPFYDPVLTWEGGLPEMVPPIAYAWDSDIEVYVALGSDYGSWRIGLPTGTDNTDAFIVAIVQYEPARVSLISVPRDLYVFIPGFGMSRINTAYRHGGAEMVADTIRYNLGLPSHGFGYVRMEAFSRFIDDALHGLMVNVGKPVIDSCSDIEINMLEGEHFMDGPTALCYGRIRAFDGGFNRQNRQRELLQAIKAKFVEIAADDPIGLASELVKAYASEHRYTDVGLDDMLRLVPTLINADIVEYNLDYDVGLVQYTHPDTGAWLVLPPPVECMSYLMEMATLGFGWDNLPETCTPEP